MPIGRAPAAARSRTSAPPPQPMSTMSLPAGATRRSSIDVSVGGSVDTAWDRIRGEAGRAVGHRLSRRAVDGARLDRQTAAGLTPLCTVRSADLIIVLESGRVVQSGSHDELMRAEGTYAELFGLQARASR